MVVALAVTCRHCPGRGQPEGSARNLGTHRGLKASESKARLLAITGRGPERAAALWPPARRLPLATVTM